MIGHVAYLHGPPLWQRLLHSNIPRLHVRVVIIFGDYCVRLAERRGINDAVEGITDRNRRREAGLESCRGSVGQECRLVRVELLVTVIRAHREVVSVGIVLKGHITDAKASPEYRLFSRPICKAKPGSEAE